MTATASSLLWFKLSYTQALREINLTKPQGNLKAPISMDEIPPRFNFSTQRKPLPGNRAFCCDPATQRVSGPLLCKPGARGCQGAG